MSDAITARLGLDAESFKKGLLAVEQETKARAAKVASSLDVVTDAQKRAVANSTKAAETAGELLKTVAKGGDSSAVAVQTASLAVKAFGMSLGTLTAVQVGSALVDRFVQLKTELDECLERTMKLTSVKVGVDFTSVDELRDRISNLHKQIQEISMKGDYSGKSLWAKSGQKILDIATGDDPEKRNESLKKLEAERGIAASGVATKMSDVNEENTQRQNGETYFEGEFEALKRRKKEELGALNAIVPGNNKRANEAVSRMIEEVNKKYALEWNELEKKRNAQEISTGLSWNDASTGVGIAEQRRNLEGKRNSAYANLENLKNSGTAKPGEIAAASAAVKGIENSIAEMERRWSEVNEDAKDHTAILSAQQTLHLSLAEKMGIELKYRGQINQAIVDGNKALEAQLRTQKNIEMSAAGVRDYYKTPQERAGERAAQRKAKREKENYEKQVEDVANQMARGITDFGTGRRGKIAKDIKDGTIELNFSVADRAKRDKKHFEESKNKPIFDDWHSQFKPREWPVLQPREWPELQPREWPELQPREWPELKPKGLNVQSPGLDALRANLEESNKKLGSIQKALEGKMVAQ